MTVVGVAGDDFYGFRAPGLSLSEGAVLSGEHDLCVAASVSSVGASRSGSAGDRPWWAVRGLCGAPVSGLVGPGGHERSVGLDVLRGLAVALMLLDHVLAPLSTLSRIGWVGDLRIFTRPSLALFMVVSGFLLASGGSLLRQAKRVAPYAFVASYAGLFVPGFGFPDPLASYLMALGLLFVFRRVPLLGLGVCILAVSSYPWNLPFYDPFEICGFLLLGWVLAQLRPGWFRPFDVGGRALAFVGRHSLAFYVGELLLVAAFCWSFGYRGLYL